MSHTVNGASTVPFILAAVLLPLNVARSDASEPTVVARVGEEAITADEVDRTVRSGLRGQELDEAARPMLEAKALELAIGQRLVERAVRREKLAPAEGQVDAAIEKIQKDALARHATFDEYLKSVGHTPESLRRQTAWRWGWRNYLAKYLTDERRQAYFDAHLRDFDGTEVRVSHILFKVEGPPSSEQLEAAVKRADDLREQIASGQITFAEAAMKHSAGPSAVEGGDLGFIPRRGRMAEAFSRAAFELKKDEISPPVTTAFGVHLIQCTDVKPGEMTWQDARRELEPPVIQQLFDEVAAAERKQVKVEYVRPVSE